MGKKIHRANSIKRAAIAIPAVLLTLTSAATLSQPQRPTQYHNSWDTTEAQLCNELISDAPAGYLGNGGAKSVPNATALLHTPDASACEDDPLLQEIGEKNACYKLRGVNQSRLFGDIPTEYSCFLDVEMMNAADTGVGLFDYLKIKQLLYLCYGDTIPTYFVSPDKNIVFVVKQESNGNVFQFKFTKDADGEFTLSELLNQFAEAEHINNADAAHSSDGSISQALSTYISETFASEWEWYIDGDAISHFDSALSYLMVRDQIALTYGDTSVVYLFHAEKKEVVVLKVDICGAIYRYNFSKDIDGTWIRNYHHCDEK